MILWTLLAGFLFATTPQESAEALIQKLNAASIDARSQAAQDLVHLGAAAVPALRKAVQNPDREVAYHAKQCLDRIEVRLQLTPALLAIEGLDQRLVRGGSGMWTQAFLELNPARPCSPYSKLGREDLESLVERAIAGASTDQQLLEVLQMAHSFKLTRCRPSLETMFRAKPSEFRAIITRILIQGDREGFLARAEPFLQDADTHVRSAAVGSLVEARAKEAIPRLIAMKNDPDIALAVGGALCQLGSKEGTAILMKAALAEPIDERHRSSLTMTLGYLGGPEIIPQMRSLLKWMERDPNTADGALRLLGNWGDTGSVPIIEKSVRDLQLSWGIRSGATRALYLMGASSSVPTLLKLAETHPDAVSVLGRIGSREAIPALRLHLAKESAAAALALGELGDRESIPAIRKLLTDRDLSRREAASTALALLDDVESAEAIGAMKEAVVARRIWPALGAMGGVDGASLTAKADSWWFKYQSEYHPQLQDGIHSSFGVPRHVSLRGAATARARPAPEVLLQLLRRKDPNQENLIAAAALCRMGRKEGVAVLLEAELPLSVLNATRYVGTWALLEGKTTTLRMYGTYQQIHRALANQAGLYLEGPPPGSDAHRAWTNVHQSFRKWGWPATLAEAFEMIEDPRWSMVLEPDRIRIVPREEALTFWRQWASK